MKIIKLSQGFVAKVDNEDYDNLIKYDWYFNIKKGSNTGYAFSHYNKEILAMHRLIMGCKKWDGKSVDHRDGDGLNNQKNNLRIATVSQNARNKSSNRNSASKYKGVFLSNIDGHSYWFSQIHFDGKRIGLGNFPFTEEGEKSAALAYNEAATEHYGEFAKLNEVQGQSKIIRRVFTSNYRGVMSSKEKRKDGIRVFWRVMIRVNNKLIHLGRFPYDKDGEIRAALMYNDAALKYFGETAKINNL